MKCKWADTTHPRGFRKDAWQFTSVNFSQCIHIGEHEEDDPYIEASQAQMVYHVDDECRYPILFRHLLGQLNKDGQKQPR
ncbi:hypothetical protein CR513_42758, partial [Mucuna pruriens]